MKRLPFLRNVDLLIVVVDSNCSRGYGLRLNKKKKKRIVAFTGPQPIVRATNGSFTMNIAGRARLNFHNEKTRFQSVGEGQYRGTTTSKDIRVSGLLSSRRGEKRKKGKMKKRRNPAVRSDSLLSVSQSRRTNMAMEEERAMDRADG
ncbi:hypothetical protein OUZ56_019047 [Daphnia magna]|uniref:Uncharacterized protein n=1 Tax=Daphnia magna TaxID=35525 RepID=A0ABQ9ZAH2_9CRUS|nr:hypothetical protein OUZ56_019047 [Daphnia magna]